MNNSWLLTMMIITCVFTFSALNGYSQVNQQDPAANNSSPLMEFPDDDYLPSPREDHETSPAYSFESPEFSVVQVNVDVDGNNILGDAANEPSITYDPLDPDRIAIGWRQFDNISSNFRQAGYAFTTNGGDSWTFPGVIDPGVFRSDPVLRSDRDGNFYYNSLTSPGGNFLTNVYKSENGGETWTMGTFSQGGDKQWMSIDMTDGPGSGNIYEFWNGDLSICFPNDFTRSVDGNLSYEACSSLTGNPTWGTSLVSPDGTLYLCGRQFENFLVLKSSNAQYSGETVSWDLVQAVDLGGSIIGFGGFECPNPEGLLGQAIIAMDSTGGPGDGNLYLLCSVDDFGGPDPCDVRFSRSTDGGLTWSASVRVNDDISTLNYQWFGTMSVAPDGRIDVIWLDTRDNPGSVNSALYYSYSLDQGETWEPNIKLSESFNPHLGWPQQFKMGDYFDMYSDETGAHLAWAATFNAEQDVYYSLITPEYVAISENTPRKTVTSLYEAPNPFKDKTTIHYKLTEKQHVTLKVFSMTGQEVSTLVNETQQPGLHSVDFIPRPIESGMYVYLLSTDNEMITRRLVCIK
jgi:hypothetical protein